MFELFKHPTASLLLAGLFSLPAYSAQTLQDADALVEQLTQEFMNSYPEKPKPSGKIKNFELTAGESQWGIVPPYQTAVWAYNGTVPGPVICIKLGETLKVKLTNQLAQPTTVHWHGVRVPNAMDGVPGVTQAPIEAGGSFTYEFTPKDPGTFWFHPHHNPRKAEADRRSAG